MFHLVYISSAVVPFSAEELLDLLAKCRKNNARSGLTGMLLYKDGNFMQALEGEETAVRTIHARIEADPRHRGLITLLQGPMAQRQFPEWSMGFRVPRSAELISAPGFSQFLNNNIPSPEASIESTLTDKLLLTFRKAM